MARQCLQLLRNRKWRKTHFRILLRRHDVNPSCKFRQTLSHAHIPSYHQTRHMLVRSFDIGFVFSRSARLILSKLCSRKPFLLVTHGMFIDLDIPMVDIFGPPTCLFFSGLVVSQVYGFPAAMVFFEDVLRSCFPYKGACASACADE